MKRQDITPAGANASKLLATLEGLLELEATELKPTLDAAGTQLAHTLNAEKVDIFLYEPAHTTLVAMGTSKTPLGQKQKELGLDLMPLANGGRAVQTYQTGIPYRDGHVDQDTEELRGIREGLGIRSTINVPLLVDGERRGVLQADSLRPQAFSEADLAFLNAVAHWFGLVISRVELVARLTGAAAEQARRGTAEELVTVLAHDLGNYLTPLEGRLGLMRRRARSDGRQADLIDAEAALASLQRLQHIIRNLLDVTRLEQGIFTLHVQPCELCALVQVTVETLSSAERPITVHVPDRLTIEGDPDRLRQAIENLLTNALKHTPPQVPITVELTREANNAGEWAVFRVHDEGLGIPADVLPHLFTRYAAGARSGGLGLGLYLVQGIVHAHAGTVTVESQPGTGTTFTVTLPISGPSTGDHQ